MADNVFQFPGSKKTEQEATSDKSRKRDRAMRFDLGDEYIIQLNTDNQLTIFYGPSEVIPPNYRLSIALNRPVLPWEEAILSCVRDLNETILDLQQKLVAAQKGNAPLAANDEPPVTVSKMVLNKDDVVTHNVIWTFNMLAVNGLHTVGKNKIQAWNRDAADNWLRFGNTYLMRNPETNVISHGIAFWVNPENNNLSLYFLTPSAVQEDGNKLVTRQYELPDDFATSRHVNTDSVAYATLDENTLQWIKDAEYFLRTGTLLES